MLKTLVPYRVQGYSAPSRSLQRGGCGSSVSRIWAHSLGRVWERYIQNKTKTFP